MPPLARLASRYSSAFLHPHHRAITYTARRGRTFSASTTMAEAVEEPLRLYANPACPWAQRAYIALTETGVPFE